MHVALLDDHDHAYSASSTRAECTTLSYNQHSSSIMHANVCNCVQQGSILRINFHPNSTRVHFCDYLDWMKVAALLHTLRAFVGMLLLLLLVDESAVKLQVKDERCQISSIIYHSKCIFQRTNNLLTKRVQNSSSKTTLWYYFMMTKLMNWYTDQARY